MPPVTVVFERDNGRTWIAEVASLNASPSNSPAMSRTVRSAEVTGIGPRMARSAGIKFLLEWTTTSR